MATLVYYTCLVERGAVVELVDERRRAVMGALCAWAMAAAIFLAAMRVL